MDTQFEAVPLDQKLKEVGKALATARTARGLSKNNLVKNHGIRKATLIRIENGDADFSFSTLLEICNQIGVTIKITFE